MEIFQDIHFALCYRTCQITTVNGRQNISAFHFVIELSGRVSHLFVRVNCLPNVCRRQN
jgi:hypothetical protein